MSTVSTERLQILVDFADEIQPLLETVGEAIQRLLKRPGDTTAATVGLDQLQILQGACLLMELDGFGFVLDGAREAIETLSGAPMLAESQVAAGHDFAALLEREGKALGKSEAPSDAPADLAEIMVRLRTATAVAAPAPEFEVSDDLDDWLDTLEEIKPGWLDSLAEEEDERAPTLPFKTGKLAEIELIGPVAEAAAPEAPILDASDPAGWTEELPVVRPVEPAATLAPIEELPAPLSADKATKELDELWDAWDESAAAAAEAAPSDGVIVPFPTREGFGRSDFAAAASTDDAVELPAAELRPTASLDEIDFDSLLESIEQDYPRPDTAELPGLAFGADAVEAAAELPPAEQLAPAGVGNAEALAVFATERVRLLTTLSQARAELTANPDDETALMNLTWATHTLRGAANLVGAELIGDVCHLMKRAAERLEAQGAEARAEVLPFLDLAERALHELIDAGYPTEGVDLPHATGTVTHLTALYAEIDATTAPTPAGSAGGWDYLPPEIAAELEGLNIDDLDEATLARVAALLDAHDAAQAGASYPSAASPAEVGDLAATPSTETPALAIHDSAEFSDDELAAILDGATAALTEPALAASPAAAETATDVPVAEVTPLVELVSVLPVAEADTAHPEAAPTTLLRPGDPTTLLGADDPTTLLTPSDPTTLLTPSDPTTLLTPADPTTLLGATEPTTWLRAPEPTTLLGPILGDDDQWAWAPPEPPAASRDAHPTGALGAQDDAAFEAELRAVFMAEAEEHLATINRALLALETTPDDAAHMREVRRSVHTLKGSAAAVGIDTIADFCHVWEDALDAAEGEASPATELSLLLECTEALERYVRHPDEFNAALDLAPLVRRLLGAVPAAAPVAEVVAEVEPEYTAEPTAPAAEIEPPRLVVEAPVELEPAVEAPQPAPLAEAAPWAAEADAVELPEPVMIEPAAEVEVSLPAPVALPTLVGSDTAFDWSPPELVAAAVDTDPDDAAFEAELRAVFMAEAEEHLTTINRALLALETTPSDHAHMREVRRAVHTLKGSAAAVGITTISEFCHVWEDALDAAAEGEASPATELSLLLECTEALERYVRHPDEFNAALELTPLVQRLSQTGETAAEPVATLAEPIAEASAAPAETEATKAEVEAVPAPEAVAALDAAVEAAVEPTQPTLVAVDVTTDGVEAVGEPELTVEPVEVTPVLAKPATWTVLPSEPVIDAEPQASEPAATTVDERPAAAEIAAPTPTALADHDERLTPAAVAALDALTGQFPVEAAAETQLAMPVEPGPLPTLLVPEAAPLAPAASIEPTTLRAMFPHAAATGERPAAPRSAAPEPAQAATAGGADMLRVPLARIDALITLVGELVVQRSGLVERLERLGGGIGDLEPSIQRLRRLGVDLEDRFGYFEDFRGPSRAPAAGPHHGEWDELEFDRYGDAYQLSRDLVELAQDFETTRRELAQLYDDAQLAVLRQGRTASGLHDELLGLRLVPLAQLLPRLQRTVRQAALKSGKDVTFLMEGGETQLDKTLLEEIADPLLHLLRNSVDHGIEAAAERQQRGKPTQGTIKIVSFREAGEVVVQIWDDGAGIDPAKVLAKARARGIVPKDTPDDPAIAYDVIFAPGFSTAAMVTDLSGRGVGLDVVRAALTRAKGTVSVASQPGEGTVFTLRVPALLVVAPALVVTAGKQRLAIPLANVRHVRRVLPQQLVGVGDAQMLPMDGQMLPVRRLAPLLGLDAASDDESGSHNLIVVAVGDRQAAVIVDDIVGQQETVIKAPAPPFDVLPGLSGVSLQGNGEVLLVLNPLELLPESELRSRSSRLQPVLAVPEATTLSDEEVEAGVPAPTIGAPDEVPTVLVVDDSLSVRRVVTRTLERHGWRVRQARDGVEALEEVRQLAPHVLLVDIEMPRMDGFELAGTLKKQSLHQHLPIVMLTSRGGEKHRTKAFDIGVDAYLVKPYQEAELVRVLREVALSAPAGAA